MTMEGTLSEPATPERIGPYRVMGELGHGGMGVVYLAQRADGQFDQQVALKLVKRGMDSEAILQRFLHERQILARLQHVNVARLLDGGVSDDGRPYFAMEHVAGVRLTDYCDARRLDIEARLRLFEQVCRAVQYAHANLIVHRDLKPSNMLVTDDGHLKLLDFGIAKLLAGEEEDGTIAPTEVGLSAMTPEYAAPELARGEPVTTAADVYALGVVLYELLSGHRPHRLEGWTPQTVALAIDESEPERPSVAVYRQEEVRRADGTTETITPQTVSRARSTRPERLVRRLQSDLDVVVLKALQKEPGRRYVSAEALAKDIRRHLAGLPVVARPDTLAYRARKFLRRHRVGMLVAGAVAASLVAGTTVAMQQARVARQEATEAEAVKEYVISLFRPVDPSELRGETITARELLDAGAARVTEELSGQPAVQAEMMTVLGGVYLKLGLYEPAKPLLEQALELQREVLGMENEEVAISLGNLARLKQDDGDYETSESLFREALAMWRKLEGDEHPEVAQGLNNLAVLLRHRGDYAGAEAAHREALAMRRKLLGDDHLQIAHSLNNLGVVLHRSGDLAAAEPLYREALAMRRKLLGDEHTYVATSLHVLAWLLDDKGEYDDSESLNRQALAMRRKLLGDEHPEVTHSLGNLGRVLFHKGDYAAAEPLYREALAMRRKLLSDEHPEIAMGLSSLAVVLTAKGDHEAVEPLLREALAMFREAFGGEHPHVAHTLHNLAEALGAMGDYDEFEPLLRQAIAIYRQRPDQRSSLPSTLGLLARRKLDLKEIDEAESLYGEALAIEREIRPAGDVRIAHSLIGLGEVAMARQQHEEAERLLREALEIRLARLPEGHWQRAEAQSALGACLSAQGRLEEAERLLVDGYDGLKASRGRQQATTRRAARYLAAHYERRGLPEKAAALRRSTPS